MYNTDQVPESRRIRDPDVIADILEAEHQCTTRLNDGEEMVYELVLYENQRKTVWGTWGADNLLPTERAEISHGDGTASYNWVPGVPEPDVVPPAGWRWRGGWEVLNEACDEQGWQYDAPHLPDLPLHWQQL